MKLHELHPPAGARRPRRRVARGTAGKGGKTAGRGTKGQGARNNIRPGFEGGQLPLTQRLPKLRGFNNPFRVAYRPVDIADLARLQPSQITPEVLVQAGLAREGTFVKVLGKGPVDRALNVKAHGFSAGAKAAIEAGGGTVDVIPLPYKGGRPPAKGNAHANR